MLSLSALLLACPQKDGQTDDTGDTGDAPEDQTVVVDGGGYACLLDDGTDDLSTGLVHVVLADCLSGCAFDLSSGCEATVVGDTIEVVAWGEFSTPGGNPDCLAVCVELTADCDVSGISEETTQLTYDEQSVSVDYPAQDSTCTEPGS
jgi:hypothetical protein